MRYCSFLVAGVLLYGSSLKGVTIEEAFSKLQEGNKRFLAHTQKTVFEKKASGQAPFAVILSCADSRVPAELIFDQGFGDLFVVRVAGNVASPAIVDSILFAADSLKAPLIVVLGHQNCGAIGAALTSSAGVNDLPNIIPYILPGIEKSKTLSGDRLESAIKANVLEQIRFLNYQPVLSQLISSGKLKILGGYYHLDSGKIEWLQSSESE